MFTETITTSLGDTDLLGHINNIVFARWFEQARNPIFRMFVEDLGTDISTWRLVMAHSEYDFLAETFFGIDVEVKTWVEKIGNSSFTIYHEAYQNEKICAKSRVIIVHYDLEEKKSSPIPEKIREKLSKHLTEQ